MRPIDLIVSGIAIGMLVPASATAQTESNLPPLLPREKEIAIALSAAPAHLAGGATVYVLERGGYVKVREGTNGFTCLIERPRPLDFEPLCVDAHGGETILPKMLREAELRAQGKAPDEVKQEIAEEYRTGKLRPPEGWGITYMLSNEAYSYSSRTGQKRALEPHVMFYAPYLSNAEIGSDGRSERLPFVVQEGEPISWIIFYVRNEE